MRLFYERGVSAVGVDLVVLEAAELAEQDHPAHQVSRRHMQTLRGRLLAIARRLNVPRPEQLATQLAVLVNGAFVSSGLLGADEATGVLRAALKSLLDSARVG